MAQYLSRQVFTFQVAPEWSATGNWTYSSLRPPLFQHLYEAEQMAHTVHEERHHSRRKRAYGGGGMRRISLRCSLNSPRFVAHRQKAG